MTIESGNYCQYCADVSGQLLPFEETVQRFIQFAISREPDLAPEQARRQTIVFMSEREAWRDHPELRAALDGEQS